MLLDQKAYNFTKKILSLENMINRHKSFHNHEHTSTTNSKKEKEININEINIETKKDEKRIIGSTDYKKFEDLAKGIEKKEEEIKKEEKEEKEKDFNDEFLENYNEFSPSWRKEVDKMIQRKQNKK